MMIKHIDTLNTIDLETETHYAMLFTIDPNEYPQVHDFYELILTLDGTMELEVNETTFILPPGTLFLIRPGDIHTKVADEGCHHINLAFPKQTVDDLFEYFYLGHIKLDFSKRSTLSPIYLSKNQKNSLQDKFEKLHLLPLDNKLLIKVHLRHLIMDTLATYFILNPDTLKEPKEQFPEWFNDFIKELHKKEVFSQSNEAILALTNKTHEHICRIFKKYLNMTPTQYFNDLRLNYAANLLLHTDQPIIDIAFTSGFQSLSYFYHLFHNKYGTSPSKFRKNAPHHT